MTELTFIRSRLEANSVTTPVVALGGSPRKLHKLQVKVRLPDLKVRAQDRYYTQ